MHAYEWKSGSRGRSVVVAQVTFPAAVCLLACVHVRGVRDDDDARTARGICRAAVPGARASARID
jgi:hypothetical protein